MCRPLFIAVTIVTGLVAWMPAFAAMPPIRISIDTPGMHAIDRGMLAQAAGIGVEAVDLEPLVLRDREGRPVAMHIDGDRIVFHAEGIAPDAPLFRETDLNVYWLEAEGGLPPGARMATTEAAPADSPSPAAGWEHRDHVEEGLVYDPGVGFPEGAPRWFMAGPVQAGEEARAGFMLSGHADPDEEALLRVTLQGKTDDPAMSLDHRTRLLLNDCVLGAQEWSGRATFVQEAVIPSSPGCLDDGENVLIVENLVTGATVNSIYLHSFDVTYTRIPRARDDRIEFGGTAPAALGGFTTPDITVYAVGEGAAVRRLVHPEIVEVGDEGYRAGFADPAAGDGKVRYRLLTRSRYRTPAALAPADLDRARSLRETGHRIDYVMISHPAFLQAIEPLAEHRRAAGLRVRVVDVNDVYAAFSGGVSIARAIRDFLAHAYHEWEVTPAYVLLVGDAAVSFKADLAGGKTTYVPTHFYRAFDGAMVPSDQWFVTVDGDDPLPDMYIGRLPVTPESAEATVQKIIDYDRRDGSDTGWMNQALFVADEEPQFAQVSDDMVDALGSGYRTNRVYMGQPTHQGGARNAVINHLTNGNVLTTYTGHGNSSQWSTRGIITSDDVEAVTNRDRLTFFVALNCLNGYFVLPSGADNRLSLAGAFVTAQQGGAVAAWAASYLGFTADHEIMGERLFASIRQQDGRGLGAVTTEARIRALADGADADTLDAYLYFGDPATVLASRGVVDGGSGGSGGSGRLEIGSLLLLLLAGLSRYHRRGGLPLKQGRRQK